MKKIQVFGTGCPKCNQLETNAKEAVAKSGIEAQVEKITDINQIAEDVVDGGKKARRQGPCQKIGAEVLRTPDEIVAWLQN